MSLIEPGDKVLVPIFGRFGHLLAEIAGRCGAEVPTIETEWGTVFAPEPSRRRSSSTGPSCWPSCMATPPPPWRSRWTTSARSAEATMPALRRRHRHAGRQIFQCDAWNMDAASAGLQKCLSGPPGSAPITFNARVEQLVLRRKHVEAGIRPPATRRPTARASAPTTSISPCSWTTGARRGSTTTPRRPPCSMRRANAPASCCGKVCRRRIARHAAASRALRAGLRPWAWSSSATAHKMRTSPACVIPGGVDGEKVRARMLQGFRHRDRHLVRAACTGDLAHRHDGLQLPQGQRADLPRRAGGGAAPRWFHCPPGAGVDAACRLYEGASIEQGVRYGSRKR